jgi:hypothetical protein
MHPRYTMSHMFPPLAVPEGVEVEEGEGDVKHVCIELASKFIKCVLQDGRVEGLDTTLAKIPSNICLSFILASYLSNVSVQRRPAMFPDVRGVLDRYVRGLSPNEQSRIHLAIMFGCIRGMYSHVFAMIRLLGERSKIPLRCRGKEGEALFKDCRPDTRPGKTTGPSKAPTRKTNQDRVDCALDAEEYRVYGKKRSGREAMTRRIQQEQSKLRSVTPQMRQIGMGAWDAEYGTIYIPDTNRILDLGNSVAADIDKKVLSISDRSRTVDLGNNITMPANEIIVFDDAVRCVSLASFAGAGVANISTDPHKTYRLFHSRHAKTCMAFNGIIFYNLVCMIFAHEKTGGSVYPDIYTNIEGLHLFQPLFQQLWGPVSL